jgi:tripartite-type tricarboxylate transporter receptor subunit TctC
MPPEIVAKLNAAINQVVAKPDVQKRLAGLGFDAFSSTPEAFSQFVGSQLDLWGKLIRDAGIEQQ